MRLRGRSAQWILSGAFYLALVASGGSLLIGQGNYGTILGTVRDSSNAVLPGVELTITNTETGVSRTGITGARGEYRVTALPPGTYEIHATMSGFQTGVRTGVTLSVGQDATVNFTLEVGSVAESVTVTGEAPMVETTNAVVSQVVDPTMMREIPLNNRSFLDLVPMTGGAIFVETADSSATKGFGRKLAITGTRYTENSFLLDGASMNDAAGAAGSADGTIAGVETVREFRVITNAYDAEHGRHTGGVISAVTKSGTNNLHGSVFEFLRNDNLDAANWADNARGGGVKPEFRRNQFGFSLGGPVVRDKTFFFGSYEGLREFLGQTQTFNVPSLSARSGLLGASQTPTAIDPDVKPFLDSFPLPNGASINPDTTEFSEPRNRVTDHDFWAGKIDHHFSESDSIASRFVYDNTDRENPDSLNTGELHFTRSRFLNVEHVHIFSPALLSKTMVAFNRTNIAIQDFPIPGTNFPRTTFSDLTDGFGNFSVSGWSTWGGGTTNPKKNVQNNYQWKQDFTYTVNTHALKFGFHFDRFQVNQRSEARGFGTFSFGSPADFFAGIPDQATFLRPGSDTIRGYRQNLYGVYLQDDIQLTDRLTLNLGLRYEFTNTPDEVNGKVANVRDLREHFLYSFTEQDVSIGDPWYLNPSLMNFAPRLGVAWNLFGDGRTSLRAGVGLFHSMILPSNLLTWGVRVPPFFVNVFLERGPLLQRTGQTIDFPNTYFTQPFVRTPGLGGLARADGFQWNPEQPKVYKWSMDIEQELLRNLSVQVGYSGTRGVHLQRGPLQIIATLAEMRPYQGGQRRFIATYLPYPSQSWSFFRWAYTDGTSDYHALRLNVNKRFSSGLQFQTSYTFSKSTDTGSSWTGSNDFQGEIRGYRDTKLPALSAFDFRHNFSSNFVYDLPGANLTGPAKVFLGGWSLGGILRFNTGFPLNVSMQQPRPSPTGQSSTAVTPTNVDGPSLDLIPGGNNNPVLDDGRNPDQYFDVRQFTIPLVVEGAQHGFFQGNLGRNTLISPGIANFDVTFTKNTALPFLGEAGNLQFRAEFYNLLNRVNFGSPATQIFSRPRNGANLAGDLADPWTRRLQASAARINDTRTSSRQLQFGLKVIF
ncbi:MAG TPA: TonB-dependent receptor [Terriglobia bacterium]|nr:TonB-dependent receptor [Terriglobia bacterium]